MEHILQFGVSIDEGAIVKAAEDKAAREIMSIVQKDVKEYAAMWQGRKLEGIYREEVKRVTDENKDYIIKTAVEELVRNLSKTKAVKEAMAEVLK